MGQSAGVPRAAQCPQISYIPIMARTIILLSLVSVVLTQDRYWGSYTASYPAGGGGDSGNVALARQVQEVGWNPRQDTERERSTGVSQTKSSLDTSLYSSAASESVEPGQYVHNPDWDLTPYQIWKRKQAAKAGTTQISANTIAAAPVEKKVVTVRRPKPAPQPAVYQQPQPQQQQPRFDNFQAVQQPARQQPRRPAQPAFQPAPRREQAYYQPAPVQQQRPAPQQQSFQPRPQPQQVQPAYQGQQFAYPRAQHQTYTDQYIYEANNNAQRTYTYTAPTYQAQAKGESYSYQAQY